MNTSVRTSSRPLPFGTLGAAAIGILASAISASAQTITVSFVNFAAGSGLTLNGSATTVANDGTASDGTVIRLTQDNSTNAGFNQAGSAFFTNTNNSQVAVNGFSTAFNFRLTNPGGVTDAANQVGADGFTFTLQTVGANSVGSSGGSLGYDGINHSVAVEFDTFQNGGDPSSNFLAVHTNGTSTVSTATVTPNFDNGTLWTAWVDYNATSKTLEVRVSNNGTRPSAANLSQTNFNAATFLTGANVFIGFTAGTGSGYENQYITNLAFSSTFVGGGISPAAIPEPGTYALIAAGLGLMGIRRRLTKRTR